MSATSEQRNMALLLSAWAGTSMLLALIGFLIEPLIASAGPQLFVRGVAAECMAWGLIEVFAALIALQQIQSAARRPVPTSHKNIKLLRFLVRLNVIFIVLAVGLALWGIIGGMPLLAGHGVG